MEKTLSYSIIGLMLILSIGFISADTLIAGTVYDGNPSNFKVGVSVNVTCDLSTLETTSLSDGAYAVVFDVDSCGNVSVESDYEVTQIVKKIEEESSQPTTTTSSGGGSSRRYYLCGNGVCDSGETASTCPADCTIEMNLENLSNEISDFNEGLEELQGENPENKKGITGAVIGTVTSKGGIITIIALIVLIGGFLTIKKFRHKKH